MGSPCQHPVAMRHLHGVDEPKSQGRENGMVALLAHLLRSLPNSTPLPLW